MQRAYRLRGGRVHETGHDAPAPTVASRDRRQRRSEQRGEEERRIIGAPRLGERPEEHAEHDRHDVPRVLAKRPETDDRENRADHRPVQVAADGEDVGHADRAAQSHVRQRRADPGERDEVGRRLTRGADHFPYPG